MHNIVSILILHVKICEIYPTRLLQAVKCSIQSYRKFCSKFHAVSSWRQWGRRVQRLVIFGLLTLQVLVPRQNAHISRSVNMEWGFKENKCRKSDSQIFKLLKPLKISRNFAYQAKLNVIRNSEVSKKVWGLKLLSKEYGSGFAEIPSGNSRACPESWTYRPNQVMPHQGQSTHDSAPPFKGTPPYSCYEGDLTCHWSISSSGMLRTGMKTSSSWLRNFSPSRSSIRIRTTRFMLKRPLRCILRVQGYHHPSYVMIWWEVSHQGVIYLHFCKKGGENGVRVYQEDVLQGVVKQLNMTLFSGQECVFQQDSVPAQKPRQLRTGCRGTFRSLSALRIGPRRVQTSTPGTINCGLFWRTWLAKRVTTTWTVWRDPLWKQRQRSLVKVAAEIPL